jgi:chromosomal replication initiator protein
MQKIDKQQAWHEVLESVRVSVSSATFNTWLSQTHLSSLKKLDNKRYLAEIGCASSFVKATVEQRYFGLIQDSLMKTIDSPCDLTFTVKAEHKPSEKSKIDTPSPLFENREEGEELMQRIAKANIRPGFTFDNFAVSQSNQMAHAATLAVSENPGTSYNPLFIWGGVGVGKTHLMHAVGHRYLAKSEMKIIACTGEDFTNDIVEGIRNKTTQAFRQKYRKASALFVDDIQFIAGKDTVQEEFFHTFNAVTAAGGQIILTSDRPPHEIAKLEERLRSRFEAGLIVDISPPDFELRCAIIQIKAQEKGVSIDDELVQLIAGTVESARRIEGVLIRLQSESNMKGQPVDTDMITGILGKGVEEERAKKATPDSIIEAICTHYSIGKRALLGKGRSKMIAHPRQVLMYILRIDLNLPLEEVGRLVGGRDHSTVIHGVGKITKLASADSGLRDDIMRIKSFL